MSWKRRCDHCAEWCEGFGCEWFQGYDEWFVGRGMDGGKSHGGQISRRAFEFPFLPHSIFQ
jgi:hypothetical protein